jgi:hypothetical protein
MKLGLRAQMGALVTMLCTMMTSNDLALAQVRTYDVQWTNTAPTIDATISAGEWAAAAPAAGNWQELRLPETDMDTAGNRFQMMWDASGLYFLHQSNQTVWTPPASEPNPNINFGNDTLNMYFDPNTDDEPNFDVIPDDTVDGYQLAWEQRAGTIISTNANRGGVGVFTEAHIDTGFGDQANWNRGGTQVGGAAMQDIVIAQNNGANGSLTELYIPWSNFNADVTTPLGDYNRNNFTDASDYVLWRDTLDSSVTNPGDGADGDLSTVIDQPDYDLWQAAFGGEGEPGTSGLYHAFAPANDDTWFFQLGQIYVPDPDNFLPVYNWTPSQSFTHHPHAEITFVGRPASALGSAAVPEPASVLLMALAAMGLASLVRRS